MFWVVIFCNHYNYIKMDLILYLLGYQPTQNGIMVCTKNEDEAKFIQKWCGGEIKQIAGKFIIDYISDIKHYGDIPQEVVNKKLGDNELLFWYKYSMRFKNRPIGKSTKYFKIWQHLSRESYTKIAHRISDILWRKGIKINYKKQQIGLTYLAFEEIRIRAGEIQEGEDYERS